MEQDHLSRKLAVILHADVVGSTLLVQKNEALAHGRIQAAFNNFSETIATYGGVAREIRGDALVAEFDRASDAVNAAIAFQAKNEESNENLDDDIRPSLRIGISLGEVIVANSTITGTGVVLAQRLEQLAEPGGVVVQGSVFETVPTRMPFDFVSLGKQTLKGFDQPVKAFTASLRSGEELPPPEVTATPYSVEPEGLQVPDKPSIAVLPFTNMSSDPEQEFFSDGITEDIITELSKVSALMVIARNTTFVYKGEAVDVKQVGNDLGVRYVLEGSVRKSGNRVRITAQLIDAPTGQHTWAERYDRELEDIFSLQDEIMREIVSALDIEILAGEQSRFWSDGTNNLQAWEYFRQARDLFNRYRSENHPEIIRLCQRALEFDPDYSAAWQLLASCYFHIEDDTSYPDTERKQAGKLSKEYLKKSLKFDPSNPHARSLQAICYLSAGEFDKAVSNANEAVAMAPNHANIIASSAMVLTKCGQPELGLQRIRKAIRLCPVYPMWYLVMLGQACRVLGKIGESIEAYSEMVSRDPDHIEGHIGLAGILSESGNIEQARASAAEVLRINPDFLIDRYFSNIAYRDQAVIMRFAEGLRKAGLPE
jgi:adenylate cyclase